MPVLLADQESPPSVVRYTPPVDMATSTDAGSVGCGTIVWIAWPPNPAPQCSRCGCSHKPLTSSYVRPPSTERNSAEGCVPAYTRSGSLAGPGANCQTRTNAVSASAGNASG